MAVIHHIGLIPDGNRRWADKNNLDYCTAYNRSMENIAKFAILAFDEWETDSLSIYLLSKDNLKRRRDDVEAVIQAETIFISGSLLELAHRLKCRIVHAGLSDILPRQMASALQRASAETFVYGEKRMYILAGYSPIDELNACLGLHSACLFSFENLWVPELVDVVIRTAGGPCLLSNFLPLQCGYAQVYILDKYFNDCDRPDFVHIHQKASGTKMLFGQ